MSVMIYENGINDSVIVVRGTQESPKVKAAVVGRTMFLSVMRKPKKGDFAENWDTHEALVYDGNVIKSVSDGRVKYKLSDDEINHLIGLAGRVAEDESSKVEKIVVRMRAKVTSKENGRIHLRARGDDDRGRMWVFTVSSSRLAVCDDCLAWVEYKDASFRCTFDDGVSWYDCQLHSVDVSSPSVSTTLVVRGDKDSEDSAIYARVSRIPTDIGFYDSCALLSSNSNGVFIKTVKEGCSLRDGFVQHTLSGCDAELFRAGFVDRCFMLGVNLG